PPPYPHTLSLHDALPISSPGRIDTSGRSTCCVSRVTVRRCAISCARYPQGSGHRDLFSSVRQACGDVGVAAYRSGGCPASRAVRSEEHTSELQSLAYLVC